MPVLSTRPYVFRPKARAMAFARRLASSLSATGKIAGGSVGLPSSPRFESVAVSPSRVCSIFNRKNNLRSYAKGGPRSAVPPTAGDCSLLAICTSASISHGSRMIRARRAQGTPMGSLAS